MNLQPVATAEQRAAARELVEMIGGSWATQAIGVAAQLGLADHVAQGLTHVDALARTCACDASALHRLLRGLAALGLLHLGGDGHCRLTGTGELLRRDAPLSLNAHAQWWSQQAWGVWSDLLGSLRTGQSTRQREQGHMGFDHLDADAPSARLFHRSMVELTRLVAADLAANPALPDDGTVMDLGGGHGALLAEVLRTRPALRGVLFDLGHAVAGAHTHLRDAGLSERVTVRSGDFFEALPGPVEVVLLKSVLHDWNDGDAVRILRRARDALAPQGRVLVIERVLADVAQDQPGDRTAARSDLNMLVGLGGRERTMAAYDRLLSAAGLSRRRALPSVAAFSVIEAEVASGVMPTDPESGSCPPLSAR